MSNAVLVSLFMIICDHLFFIYSCTYLLRNKVNIQLSNIPQFTLRPILDLVSFFFQHKHFYVLTI